MSEYRTSQIDRVLKDNDEFFRIKIQGDKNETHWMDVSPANLKRIKAVMRSEK
jgi:hypothetical protein